MIEQEIVKVIKDDIDRFDTYNMLSEQQIWFRSGLRRALSLIQSQEVFPNTNINYTEDVSDKTIELPEVIVKCCPSSVPESDLLNKVPGFGYKIKYDTSDCGEKTDDEKDSIEIIKDKEMTLLYGFKNPNETWEEYINRTMKDNYNWRGSISQVLTEITALKNEAVKRCNYETGATFRDIESKLKRILEESDNEYVYHSPDAIETKTSIPGMGWRYSSVNSYEEPKRTSYDSDKLNPLDEMKKWVNEEFLSQEETVTEIVNDVKEWFFNSGVVEDYILSVVKKAL